MRLDELFKPGDVLVARMDDNWCATTECFGGETLKVLAGDLVVMGTLCRDMDLNLNYIVMYHCSAQIFKIYESSMAFLHSEEHLMLYEETP